MIGIEEYERNTVEILKAFLMHGKSQFKDKRKLEGYGLKMDDFLLKFKNENNRSYSSATKRMFVPRKNELLSNHYITPIRSKGKQAKYFSITPVGIAYLFQKFKPSDDLITEFFNQIIKYLIFYHETTKHKLGYAKLLEDHHRMFQIHDNTKLSKKKEIVSLSLIFKTMNNIKITHYGENETVVDLTYSLYFDTVVNYATCVFTHQKNKLPLFLEKDPISEVEEFKLKGHTQGFDETTEEKIYQKISTFIIRAFFYESISNRIIDLEHFKNITRSSTSKIKQLENEFKNIPAEYLFIANDFSYRLDSILFLSVEELSKTRGVISKQLWSLA